MGSYVCTKWVATVRVCNIYIVFTEMWHRRSTIKQTKARS